MKTTTINCATVGTTDVFTERIAGDRNVSELKATVRESMQYKVAAETMRLYLTKQDGRWMKWTDPERQQLGDIDNYTEAVAEVKKYTQIPSLLLVGDDEFALKSSSQHDIHVLVLLPPGGLELVNAGSSAGELKRFEPQLDGGAPFAPAGEATETEWRWFPERRSVHGSSPFLSLADL